ncbi:MAG: gluconokinase [Bacteroidota bacterium]
MNKHRILIIMGVSGTGKSTIGKLLSEKLKVPFFDGDDFHPERNILKMKSGQPLTDEDRKDWLLALNELAKTQQKSNGGIIACSALKQVYRDMLNAEIDPSLIFIFLEGSFELISSRMATRKDHFMPIDLLKSQFDTLEIPEDVIYADISKSPSEIVEHIIQKLS